MSYFGPGGTPLRRKIVTICGSMRYYSDMLSAAESLTDQGMIVLMPFSSNHTDDAHKRMLDDMHKDKIVLSDSILVVGKHRGESTLSEIAFAESRGLAVATWENQQGS